MKIIVLFFLLSVFTFADKSNWLLMKNKILYSVTINNTKIKVYISTGIFDKANHKVIPKLESNPPKVDGHIIVGHDGSLPQASEKIPHLTRLAVDFGGKVVEAPPELISHIFRPNSNVTFNERLQYGMVTISSDGKSVMINLLVGDGAATDRVDFIFTSTGKCIKK